MITAKQAKALDLRVQNKFGIPGILLMENAGRAVSDEVLRIIKNKKAKVAIFCGKGNNGGDGFCAARHLLAAGYRPDVYLAGKRDEVRNEAKVNLDILIRMGQKVCELDERDIDLLKRSISGYGLIVDALLGIGVNGRIRGKIERLIGLINTSGAFILSVDIPSGLEATSGKALGCCVRADQTITFVDKKTGMAKRDGPESCGKIKVAGIGFFYK